MNNKAVVPYAKKRKTTTKYNSREFNLAVKNAVLNTKETKIKFDTGAFFDGGGTIDASKGFTLFRIPRGDDLMERTGNEIIPKGLRIDHAFSQTNAFFQFVKVAVVELRGSRGINSANTTNTTNWMLQHLFRGENSGAPIGTGSNLMLQCERMTHPLHTDALIVHDVKTFMLGKLTGEGGTTPYATGTYYVNLSKKGKKNEPISYDDDSLLASPPGDTECSRNICVLVWGGSPDSRSTTGFGRYSGRINMWQYFKDV